jgi:hypothetical protein
MARRTFLEYKAEVLHALGNPAAGNLDITAGSIVNDALEHVAAMHEWQWCSTGQLELGTTADQAFITLPADFGTMIAIEEQQGWATHFTPVTWEALLWMRTHPITNWTGGYYYVIQTGNSATPAAGLDAPTLELYPTPSVTDADAVRIVYRRHLRRFEGDTDVPQWPSYMDRPLSLLARSFASVDYDDDPQSAYTSAFSAMIDDCMYRDGMTLGSVGVPRGALHARTRPLTWGYPYNGIPNP